MDISERVAQLQKELEAVKQEIQELLMEMRIFLLEAQNPTRMIPAVNKTEDASTPDLPKADNRQ